MCKARVMSQGLDETSLRLALDWTPNILHGGLLIAQARNYFEEEGLKVELVSPEGDGYAKTPARRLADAEVDLAIAPSESVLAYQSSKEHRCELVAIAALLQGDTSAIVTLKSSGIDRPAKLRGRSYASYKARFEDHIVRYVIRADLVAAACELDTPEGQTEVSNAELLRITYPPKLSIWSSVVCGDADSTWVFLPWEGVQARQKGVDLNVFCLKDYGVPYGYSPVLLAHRSAIASDGEKRRAVAACLRAAARGYAALEHEGDIGGLVDALKAAGLREDEQVLRAAIAEIRGHVLSPEGQWGGMSPSKWKDFTEFLITCAGLPEAALESVDSLFDNSLLQL